MELTLSHDIKSNLDEIAERLLSNHAAVMVGAGFSMNALKISPDVKDFPSWADLGDAFYNKVNGKNNNQNAGKYLNALKLADEVQAQFGRIVLDKILQQEIPDKKYNPSRLHNKLLQLPWNDVFTTNYDTLLERASQEVISRKYDVIVRNEDLVYSEKPRIIKLHGSFPSQRPFIITEEDYRVYPTMFAPFVNTVQQSLLENALCLIGFSGNDPNFLAWIGWIRDNLGNENSSKIYLIGVFNFSSSQRMLLEKRNIIILDFSQCNEIKKSSSKHQLALEGFLDYLLDITKKKKEYDWLAGEKEYHVNYLKDADMKNILKVWSNTRMTYPGWWILPEDIRKRLWRRTDHTLLREIVNLNNTRYLSINDYDPYLQHEDSMDSDYEQLRKEDYNDLNYLYEYNWRQEKCLIPLCLDQVQIYEEILDKYKPFSDSNQTEAGNHSQKEIQKKEISEKWVDLKLALLRYYRENNDIKKLIALSDQLNQLMERLTPEQLARYNYEKCLKYLFLMKFNEIKDCLYDWKEDLMMPIWEAKRASIWAMLGEVEIASEIIGKALAEVRKQLMLAPVTTNYTAISQEAALMFLSAYYKQAINLSISKNENVFNDSYKERSAEHKKYKCDPFQEKRIFEIELSNEYVPRSQKKTESNFDLGHVANPFFTNYDDRALLTGLEFIRYLEESGIPVNVGNVSYSAKIMPNVLQRISYVNPNLTMIYTILYGDKKNTQYIFSRKSISEMDLQDVDDFCNTLLIQLKLSENEVKEGNTICTVNFGIRLAQILPEIISRLCVKCSRDVKYKIADFICKVYTSGFPEKYDKMNKLLERLVKTCDEEDIVEIIGRFLKLPLKLEEENREFLIDPFIYIDNFYHDRKPVAKKKVDSQDIFHLLCSAKKEGLDRKNAVLRLSVLYKCGLLTVEEEKEFAESLWIKIDENTGFPKETHINYKTKFFELPIPESINGEERLKKYLYQLYISMEEKIENIAYDSDYLYEHDYQLIIQDLKNSLRERKGEGYRCNWNKEERLKMVDYTLHYYKKLQTILYQNDYYNEINSYEEKLIKVNEFMDLIMDILLRQGTLEDIAPEKKNALRNIIKEFDRVGIPCYKLKLCCKSVLELNDFNHYEVFLSLSNSNDYVQLTDCFDAIYYYITLNDVEREEGSRLVSLLSWQILARRKESLYLALKGMKKIIAHKPEYITDDIFLNLINGLEYIYDESHLYRSEADYLAGIRVQAIGLAFRIYDYCNQSGRKIPSIIELWHSLCKDNNEFWEVRNAWMGMVNITWNHC